MCVNAFFQFCAVATRFHMVCLRNKIIFQTNIMEYILLNWLQAINDSKKAKSLLLQISKELMDAIVTVLKI